MLCVGRFFVVLCGFFLIDATLYAIKDDTIQQEKPLENLSLDQIALLLSPKKTFKLYPYKASYSIHPLHADEKTSIDGKMDVSLERKEGVWSYKEDGQFFYIGNTGKIHQFQWAYQTQERLDGKVFSFDYSLQKDRKVVANHKGRVEFDPLAKVGTVFWERPVKNTLTLYNKIIFPQALTARLLKLIKQAPKLQSFYVFDGKNAGVLPLFSCFVDQPKKMPWSLGFSADSPILHLVAWPVSQAMYREKYFCERLAPTKEKFGLLSQGGVFLQKAMLFEGQKVLCALRSFKPLAPF